MIFFLFKDVLVDTPLGQGIFFVRGKKGAEIFINCLLCPSFD